MIFYRIENEKGEGVYHCGVGNIAERYTNATSNMQANPHDVFTVFKNDDDKKNWFFGFPKLEDIYSWFDTFEAVAYMRFKKCKIVQYKIEEQNVHIAGNQLIFKQEHVEQIGSAEISYKPVAHLPEPYDKSTLYFNSKFKDFLKREERKYFSPNNKERNKQEEFIFC